MADRKSSDNELKTNLVDNDLFDVLDSQTGVAAEKNKSIKKSDLFTQIANELALTGDSGRITDFSNQNGWVRAATSYYRKLGKTVFVNMRFNSTSASNTVCTTLPAGFRPHRLTALSVTYLFNDTAAAAVAYINDDGEITIVKAGTASAIPIPNVNYTIAGSFDVD